MAGDLLSSKIDRVEDSEHLIKKETHWSAGLAFGPTMQPVNCCNVNDGAEYLEGNYRSIYGTR